MIECYKCGQEIFFDDDCVSQSGKKIPLDEEYDGGVMIPHDCPENPQKANTPSVKSALVLRIDALEKRIFDLENKS